MPAATEIVAALGAESSLVAFSHECDWPPSLQHLPRVTSTPIDPALSSGAIDASVRALHASGKPVIGVDAAQVRSLRPDLILTQNLCEVCAVADGGAIALVELLDPAPRLQSLNGRTLEGIYDDIASLAQVLDLADEGKELVAGLRYRMARLHTSSRTSSRPPAFPPSRLVCIEWLDPIFLAGHWVPDLIEAAGGEDLGARSGEHSRTVTYEELAALEPELILVAPCGFGLERAEREFREFERRLGTQGKRPLGEWGVPVWLLDGNAYTSRPGPRVVDGAWRIASALRGEEVPGLRRLAPAGADS